MNADQERTLPTLVIIAFAICAGLLVAACGGDGESTAPLPGGSEGGGAISGGSALAEGDPMPAEASRSVAALLSWAQGLGTNESGLPYRLDGFRPPMDDATETSPG